MFSQFLLNTFSLALPNNTLFPTSLRPYCLFLLVRWSTVRDLLRPTRVHRRPLRPKARRRNPRQGPHRVGRIGRGRSDGNGVPPIPLTRLRHVGPPVDDRGERSGGAGTRLRRRDIGRGGNKDAHGGEDSDHRETPGTVSPRDRRPDSVPVRYHLLRGGRPDGRGGIEQSRDQTAGSERGIAEDGNVGQGLNMSL